MTSVVDRNMSKYIYDKILGMLDSLSKEHKDLLYAKLSPSTMKLEEMRTDPMKFMKYLEPSGPGTLVQISNYYPTDQMRLPGMREAITREMTMKLMNDMLKNVGAFRFITSDDFDNLRTSVKIEHRYIPFT